LEQTEARERDRLGIALRKKVSFQEDRSGSQERTVKKTTNKTRKRRSFIAWSSVVALGLGLPSATACGGSSTNVSGDGDGDVDGDNSGDGDGMSSDGGGSGTGAMGSGATSSG